MSDRNDHRVLTSAGLIYVQGWILPGDVAKWSAIQDKGSQRVTEIIAVKRKPGRPKKQSVYPLAGHKVAISGEPPTLNQIPGGRNVTIKVRGFSHKRSEVK